MSGGQLQIGLIADLMLAVPGATGARSDNPRHGPHTPGTATEGIPTGSSDSVDVTVGAGENVSGTRHWVSITGLSCRQLTMYADRCRRIAIEMIKQEGEKTMTTVQQQKTTKTDERTERRGSIQTVVMRPGRYKTNNVTNRERTSVGTS